MIARIAGYKRFGDMTVADIYRSNIRPEQHPTVKITCSACGLESIKSYMPGLSLTLKRDLICGNCKDVTTFDFEWHDKKETH